MQLVIGNKNYSSWSMRPWVLMRALGIPFEELKLRFDFAAGSAFRRAVARAQPGRPGAGAASGRRFRGLGHAGHRRNPARTFPAGRRLADRGQGQRARARSLCAEMHTGFGALRSHCPMNIEARLPEVGARLWAEQAGGACRRGAHRSDLGRCAGRPAAGRSCSAPSVPPTPSSRRWRCGCAATRCRCQPRRRPTSSAWWPRPAVAAWIADALAEHDFLADDEPYRTQR